MGALLFTCQRGGEEERQRANDGTEMKRKEEAGEEGEAE